MEQASGFTTKKVTLEQYLTLFTNELFDIKERIMIYYLTNKYFEERKVGSK